MICEGKLDDSRRRHSDGFRAERDPGRVAECIRDYAKLEASGWKAREGTAVTAEGYKDYSIETYWKSFAAERGRNL